MISQKTTADYWFTIEPYVYVCTTNQCALLYNTLDGATIESNQMEVIELLRETLQKENCGVVLLKDEKYQNKNINAFIEELREKYMGDIIDITLSKSKPVQLMPYFNYFEKHELYKKHNFSQYKNVLDNLSEISINVDNTSNTTTLIPFLQSIPGIPIFNIIGNIKDVPKYIELLSYLDQHPSPKNIQSSYKNLIELQPYFKNNFFYNIFVHFPIDMQQWKNARQLLLNQTLPFIYVFYVSSLEDYQYFEELIDRFEITKYRLNTVFTGENIDFFEENVFLTKEDILSTPMSIKDFFSRQSMNIYDFGKINIMSNGDAYANVNHEALGNIYTHSIHEIVSKEVEKGQSWFRIRDQAPCNTCIYQWLCPPPSDYEIAIGRPNLCHVNK